MSRRVRDVVLSLLGFGMMAYGILAMQWPVIAVGMLAVGLPGMLFMDRLRDQRPADPPPPPRPDADVAQYLNDADRAWLREHGDWSDPSVRIVDHGADEVARQRKVDKARAESKPRFPRAVDRVMSVVESPDGWRTTRYADGRTVEHAVTSPCEIPEAVAVRLGPPPVASFYSGPPSLDPIPFRTIRLWPNPDPDVSSVQARPDRVVVEMRDGTRHEIKRK